MTHELGRGELVPVLESGDLTVFLGGFEARPELGQALLIPLGGERVVELLESAVVLEGSAMIAHRLVGVGVTLLLQGLDLFFLQFDVEADLLGEVAALLFLEPLDQDLFAPAESLQRLSIETQCVIGFRQVRDRLFVGLVDVGFHLRLVIESDGALEPFAGGLVSAALSLQLAESSQHTGGVNRIDFSFPDAQ